MHSPPGALVKEGAGRAVLRSKTAYGCSQGVVSGGGMKRQYKVAVGERSRLS